LSRPGLSERERVDFFLRSSLDDGNFSLSLFVLRNTGRPERALRGLSVSSSLFLLMVLAEGEFIMSKIVELLSLLYCISSCVAIVLTNYCKL
jgi:hypothetical protein